MYFFKIIILFFCLSNSSFANNDLPRPIVLKTAAMIDGPFITWKTLVDTIHPFMQRLHEYVFGITNVTGIQGRYLYKDVWYTLEQLVYYEKNIRKDDPEFLRFFEQIKHELISLGMEFFGETESAKPIIVHLVKESCSGHHNETSLLLKWANNAKNGKEEELFHVYIKSIDDLYEFCIDLLVFLHDFVHSCPKARHQLHLQLEKWHKVKDMVSSMIEQKILAIKPKEQTEFLHYLKQFALPRASLNQIKFDWIYNHYLLFHGKQ